MPGRWDSLASVKYRLRVCRCADSRRRSGRTESTKITVCEDLRCVPSLPSVLLSRLSPGRSRWAAGVFAPGHLGELTRIVPFEIMSAVERGTGAADDHRQRGRRAERAGPSRSEPTGAGHQLEHELGHTL